MSTRCTLGTQFAPTFHRPFLRYVEGEQGGGDGGGEQQNQEPAFPANTPVKDMTPDQQAAYHLHQARKHENRVKSFGEWTPEKIRALEQERDQLKTSGQSDADKAIEAAREEGRTEVRAQLNKVNATHALEKALEGRVPTASALLGLDVTRFVVNGQVDGDAISKWVDDNSAEAPKGTQQKRNPDNGQGNRGDAGGSGKSVSAGRDLFADRRKKTTT